MSRLGKFMVYNPLKGKPVKYYSLITEALKDCAEVSKKEQQDCLVLQVVAKAETTVKEVITETNTKVFVGV